MEKEQAEQIDLAVVIQEEIALFLEIGDRSPGAQAAP